MIEVYVVWTQGSLGRPFQGGRPAWWPTRRFALTAFHIMVNKGLIDKAGGTQCTT